MRSNILEKEKGREGREGWRKWERGESRTDKIDRRQGREETGLQASDPDGQLRLSWEVESQMQRLSLVATAAGSLSHGVSQRKPVLLWFLPPSSEPPQGPSYKLHWVWWAESLLSPEKKSNQTPSPKQSKPDETTPNALGRPGVEEEGLVVLF